MTSSCSRSRGHRAELAHGLADGGEAGADVAGGHHVVPADDGDVVGDGLAALLQPRHDREGELVVGAHERVGVEVAGEEALREPGAVGLAELDAHRLGRGGTGPALVGLREAEVAVADVRAGVGVADEEQPTAAVVQQVQRQGAGALGVLRADRLDALVRIARDEQQRLGALQRPDGGLGDRRGAQHREAVDAGRELPHRPGEVGLAAGEHEDHALPELGRPGLEAHQQLGVVGTGELGKDQAVRLVVADGEAARGAQRHVVQLLRGGQHLDLGPVGDGGGALQDPRDRRDGDARERGDRVDRRAGALLWRRCHGPALSVESAYKIGLGECAPGDRCRARGPAGRISPTRRGPFGGAAATARRTMGAATWPGPLRVGRASD